MPKKATLQDIVDESLGKLEKIIDENDLPRNITSIHSFAICWGVYLPNGQVEFSSTSSTDFSDNLTQLYEKAAKMEREKRIERIAKEAAELN